MSAAAVWRLPSVSAAVADCNRRLRAAVDGGRPAAALLLFVDMLRAGHRPDRLSFPSALKAAAFSDDPSAAAASLHCAAAKSPSSADPFVQSALLSLYLRLGRLGFATQLFDEMPQRDLATYNAMLMGFSRLDSLSSAFGFFVEMNSAGLSPDPVSFVLLAEACAAVGSLPGTRSVHGRAVRAGAVADVAVVNTFVSAYSKCGDVAAAEVAFAETDDSRRTAVSWSSMVSAYARHSRRADALACFSQMRRLNGGGLEAAAVVSLLAVCGPRHNKALHALVIKGGLTGNSAVGDAVIRMYCNAGDSVSSQRQFEGMLTKTSTSWATMISGLASLGDIGQAVELYAAMDKPDKLAATVAVITAAGRAGELELGRALHRRAIAVGLDDKVSICNSLMDMYMKNGCPSEAEALFDSVNAGRTVVSYTIMVSGLAVNSRCREALDLFWGMVSGAARAPPPNAFTFLAALQACRHGSFLEVGCEVLSTMVEEFNIWPSVEHLACVVELMGRGGRVGEARRLVEAMGKEADEGMWGALLGACKWNDDDDDDDDDAEDDVNGGSMMKLKEMAQRAGPAGYVGLAKAEAATGRWEEAAEALVEMRRRGMRKVAGESWVRAGGRRRRFLAQGGGNPENELLETVIIGLNDAMRYELAPTL